MLLKSPKLMELLMSGTFETKCSFKCPRSLRLLDVRRLRKGEARDSRMRVTRKDFRVMKLKRKTEVLASSLFEKEEDREDPELMTVFNL